jgi:STE24 endopeptidase
VRRSERVQLIGAGVLAVSAAELATRLLTPREALPAPEPVRLSDYFAPEEIRRARRYQRPQMAISLAGGVLEAAALSWVARRARRVKTMPGGRAGSSTRAGVLGSAAYAAALSAGLTLPSLPLSALARRRSLAVGLATQGWGDWFKDLGKAGAVQAVMAGAAGATVTAAARRWPRGWWLPVAGGSVLFGTALAALAPVVLEPLFNDFTPLPEGPIRDDVLALAAQAGVRVGEVYSIDASRRTTAVNAYVSGLGPTKRVVLFDTLLDKFTREEVAVVVAHELAHVRNRDVPRNVAFAALTAPAAALAVQRLSWALSPARGTAKALPALALAAGIVSAPLGLLSSRLSRQVERCADDFSLRLSDAPEAFVSFERTIVRQNVADPSPPRILNVLATHPPTDQRIGAALAYQKRVALLGHPVSQTS